MVKLFGRIAIALLCAMGAAVSAAAAYDMINERRARLALPVLSDTGFAVGYRAARILTVASVGEDAPQVEVELTDEVRDELARDVRLALGKEPLNPDGIRALAMIASLEGKEDESFRLLQLAEHVSRRDAGTSLLLSSAYAERGEIGPVLATIDRALRSSVSARDTMLPRLMAMLAHDEAVRPLHSMLSTEPPWETDFWAASASVPEALTNVAEVRLARGEDGYAGEPIYDRRLLAALTKAREFDVAQRLFMEIGGIRPAAGNAVRNSSFKSAPGLAPFDWEIRFSNSLTADVLPKAGQLRVQTFSGGNGVVARQLISLGGGGGVLKTRAEDWDERDRESLYVRITCATNRAASINIDIEQAEWSFPFARPAPDCRYNWLEIVTRPQADRRENTIVLDSVAIAPRNGV